MKEFRDRRVIRGLLERVGRKRKELPSSAPDVRIMEVCGTHTMTVHRYGLKPLLEEAGVDMISGPGCPVCITPGTLHEAAIGLVTGKGNLILATFGDMTRVPTRRGSLQTCIPGPGSQMKIVYSPEESLDLARKNRDKEVVFFGVGFETTIPSIALAFKQAEAEKLENYSILHALWIIPPPLRAILEAEEVRINGFLYPGHVSTIIGREPYEFIPREFGIPGAIAGFEPADILLGILSVLNQVREGKPRVDIEYSRAVPAAGNIKAQALMSEILEVKDASWRGLGLIPASGLRPKPLYSPWDAEKKFGLRYEAEGGEIHGCRCGEVLRGLISPPQCALFGRDCNPERPLGPCMVSFEGACLITYKYSRS